MRKMMTAAAMAVTIAVLAGPASAAPGFYIGTGMGAAFPAVKEDLKDFEPQSAWNMELIHLGYNFTPWLGLGLQWGAAAGPATGKMLGEDDVWGQGYIALSTRFSFDLNENNCLYFEAGAGNYVFNVVGEYGTFFTLGSPGLRLALGHNFYLGNFYIAPELSYHLVRYDEGELHFDDAVQLDPFSPPEKDYNVRLDSSGDMVVFQVKIGYHWRPKKEAAPED